MDRLSRLSSICASVTPISKAESISRQVVNILKTSSPNRENEISGTIYTLLTDDNGSGKSIDMSSYEDRYQDILKSLGITVHGGMYLGLDSSGDTISRQKVNDHKITRKTYVTIRIDDPKDLPLFRNGLEVFTDWVKKVNQSIGKTAITFKICSSLESLNSMDDGIVAYCYGDEKLFSDLKKSLSNCFGKLKASRNELRAEDGFDLHHSGLSKHRQGDSHTKLVSRQVSRDLVKNEAEFLKMSDSMRVDKIKSMIKNANVLSPDVFVSNGVTTLPNDFDKRMNGKA